MAEKSEIFEISEKANTQIVKCDSCGGNMVFDPETQCLKCEHCGSKVDFEKDKQVKELALEESFNTADNWNDTAVMRCDNCGAKVIINRDEVSINCPYCGTSHVRKTEEICGVKPNALYPFLVTTEQAEVNAKKWAKRKIFAPSKFKKNLQAQNLKGIFQPCFTFDSQTNTVYNGKIGKRRTRTVRTKNGTRTETYIEWRRVSGSIFVPFDDITISSSANFSQNKMDKLMPFKRETICVYEKKYLAGFFANHYQKDIKTSWNEAKNIMNNKIRQAILDEYNCDVVGNLNTSTIHNKVTYKYVLLPLYVLNYRYKKKIYEVDVNGNTGKVIGKTPVSFWKVLIAVLIGLAVVAGIMFISNNDTSSAQNTINQILL